MRGSKTQRATCVLNLETIGTCRPQSNGRHTLYLTSTSQIRSKRKERNSDVTTEELLEQIRTKTIVVFGTGFVAERTVGPAMAVATEKCRKSARIVGIIRLNRRNRIKRQYFGKE